MGMIKRRLERKPGVSVGDAPLRETVVSTEL